MTIFKIQAQPDTVEIKVKAKDGSGSQKMLLVGFKRYKSAESQDKTDEYTAIVDSVGDHILKSQELFNFIKEEIVFIKNISLDLMDETGKKSKLKIKDTREQKTIEGLWTSSEDCLETILDSYFEWDSWKLAFISAVQSSISDIDVTGEIEKNSLR